MTTDDLARTILRARACSRRGCPCGNAADRGAGVTHCPSHDDKHPSLSARADGIAVLVHCFAGCSQEMVLSALAELGLWPRPRVAASKPVEDGIAGSGAAVAGQAGLTLAELAGAKRLPVELLQEFSLRDGTQKGLKFVEIPYQDGTGKVAAIRRRHALQGDRRFSWRRGDKPIPYGLPLKGADLAEAVLIVEGESDVWTAHRHGFAAIGIPGKATWRPEWARHFLGRPVFVWQEPDAEDFVERIGRDLPDIRVISCAEYKDLSEAHVAGVDVPAWLSSLMSQAVPLEQAPNHRREKALADALAQSTAVAGAGDPLALVEQEVRRLGYGGDIRPVVLVYLAGTSRLLEQRRGNMPAHLLLLGPPSSGKSYAIELALALLPTDACIRIDAGSPRVLIYLNDDLRHRVVVFAEADSLPAGEDNPAASAVRGLLQENRLSYKVTIRDDSGNFAVRSIDKPGPTVLITTSTASLGDQLQSRMFVVDMPADREQIASALRAAGRLQLEDPHVPDPGLVAYQTALQMQAPWVVEVPFAQVLADRLAESPEAPRLLRAYSSLLSLIKAVAVLRHGNRKRRGKKIVAEIDDYATVRDLTSAVFDSSLTGASDNVRAVVEAVAVLRGQAGPGASITVKDVASGTGLPRSTCHRVVKRAIKAGWLVNSADHYRPADLDVGEPLPDRCALPDPEAIRVRDLTIP